MNQDDTVEYNDLVRLLQIDIRKAETWRRRNQLPVEAIALKRSTRIRRRDVHQLAVWLVIAEVAGPSRTNEITRDCKTWQDSFVFDVACVTVRIDVENMKHLIWSMCKPLRVVNRAA